MPYTSTPLPLPVPANGVDFVRVDLRFVDVDQSGESFEGRVFLNQPDAGLGTPRDLEHGYVGSIYVFGHPHCWGDEGHCSLPPGPLHGFDSRRPHHLVPQIHELEITATAKALLSGDAGSVTATVVPIVRHQGGLRVDESQLRFASLQLVSYELTDDISGY